MIDTPYFFVFYDKIWRKMTFLMKGTRSGTHFWDFDSNKYRKRPTQLKKKGIFLILIFLTFCLIVSWVFDLETIAGCLIFAFGPRISNLFLDLREIYRADCQTLVLSAWSDFERASLMSKKTPGSNSETNFKQQNIKFQSICDYQYCWSLVQKFLLTGFILRYFKISQKMLFLKTVELG